jgi:hypothetical protein
MTSHIWSHLWGLSKRRQDAFNLLYMHVARRYRSMYCLVCVELVIPELPWNTYVRVHIRKQLVCKHDCTTTTLVHLRVRQAGNAVLVSVADAVKQLLCSCATTTSIAYMSRTT